ncbi:MAG TPA: DivIVA domain-containing protein [Actinomycetota bacterium]|nr:DivIVA domain-containing protein [Actinomycetota bacterium]
MSELDLPLLPNADQIRRRMFATVRRGFDPDQVREYLKQVADQVENLEARLRDAKLASEATPVATPPPKESSDVDPYAEVAGRVAELLRSADRQAQSLVADANAKTRQLLDDARTDADRIKLDAQSRAEQARASGEEALASARREAEQLLSGLTERRAALVSDLRKVRELLIAMAGELGGTIGEPDRDAPLPQEAREADRAPARVDVSAPRPATNPVPSEVDVVDPRYEDLWASPGSVELDLPDLPPLDDLEIETEERERSSGDAR